MHKPLAAWAALAALAAAPAAHALNAGDLAFTAINADEDGWALVALADISAGTTVYFTDNEWNGSAFNTGESYHQWVSGSSTIAAGTVVRFSRVDFTDLSASVGTLTRASVSGSTNYGISTNEESIFMYQAATVSATPSVFLGAITTTAFGTASAGVLSNTGLSLGSGAIALNSAATGGADFAQYTGPRTGQATFAGYQPLVYDASNWFIDTSNGVYTTTAPDVTAFAVTPVPEPGTWAMLMAGLGAVGFVARRRAR